VSGIPARSRVAVASEMGPRSRRRCAALAAVALASIAVLAGACGPQASVPPYQSLDPGASGGLGPALTPVAAPTDPVPSAT
jgi:hypothetical protein